MIEATLKALRRRTAEFAASRRVLAGVGVCEPLYGYPSMVRAGLGHMMGAWARCVVWTRTHSVPMLAPQWRQFRIGPYLRRELDKRSYHPLFTSDGYVDGVPRLAAIALARRVPEADAEAALVAGGRGPTLVVFHDDLGWETMRNHRDLLLSELLRITRPEYVRPALVREPFIGVHVRRGDFTQTAAEAALRAGRKNLRTPIEWYADALTYLRSRLGGQQPARVFSDGTDAELGPLLGLPAVTRAPNREAITDILALSQASAVVASGSGFSQWACFLGQVPSLWFPGQHHYALTADGEPPRELEWEPGRHLPDVFVDAVSRRSTAPSYLMARLP